MCLTIPVQIISLSKNKAKVKAPGQRHEVGVEGMKNLKVGDWVLTQGGLVVRKVRDREAKKILKLLK